MNWNYIGIDADPPAGKIMILTYAGSMHEATRSHPLMIAWSPIPKHDALKLRCQEILRGLPELRMIACICTNDQLRAELLTAEQHYNEASLADFVDLVRALDKQAHSGTECTSFHKHHQPMRIK